MKHSIFRFITTVLCTVLFFSSCERILVEDSLAVDEQEEGFAQLNITTRAVNGSDATVIADGRIYIFNSAGKCIQILSTDEESDQAIAQLAAGSYKLYAVGGEDLSRFSLPTQNNATPTSIITRQEGKVMDDLLMVTDDVELEDGVTENRNLVLERKVLCLDEIEIKQIPTTATKVEILLTPFYSSVQLDGNYPSLPTESYKIALTKQDDGKTWKATPHQMLFPSKGIPTIEVSITTDEGIIEYSYNATEELPANHHFTISGTYNAAQGVDLTGILTAADWGEDQSITFDFDDENQTIHNPVAGQIINGYYVVKVDEASYTAILLSQVEVDYEAPTAGSAPDLWKQALIAPMAALEKPIGVNCGEWRLPTLEEAKIITGDPKAIYYATNGNSINIFCLDGDVLNWAQTIKSGEFRHGTTGFISTVYLRPVIDIIF